MAPIESATELTQSLNDLKIKTPKRTNVDFEEALEETGFGRYNILVILVCGLVLFASNSEMNGVGYIVPAAECELNLDSYTKGILTSSNLVGVVSSSPIWGYLSDIKGRRKLMIANLILAFLTGLVAAITPSFWGFTILRLINGICIACPAAICFVYLGEFLCTKTRAKSLACAIIFIALALIYLPAVGWFLLQRTFNVDFFGLKLNNWRTYMLVNSIPSIIAVVGLAKLPETPRYLYYNGNLKEALKILREIYVSNTGKSEDSFQVESLNEKIFLEKSSRNKKTIWQDLSDQIVPLFKPPLLTYTLAACYMQASMFAISSGLYFWYPDIINQVSKSGRESVTICEALALGSFETEDVVQCADTVNDRVFVLNIIVGVGYLVAYSTWGLLVKILGTRNFFIICIAISSLGTMLLCFISQKIIIDIAFITALTLAGISVSVLSAWSVEIFPTSIGAMALCTTLTAGRLGSVIASSTTGIMLEWNCLATFLLYALSLIVCLLLSLLLPQKR